MSRRLLLLFTLALLCGTVASASERKLSLHGQILPRFRWISVSLHSTETPFRKQKLSGSKGKFKFKKLNPGSYVVTLYHPRWGEHRRSVQVTPSFADAQGRVECTIVYRRSRAARERQLKKRNMVSVRTLSVLNKAKKEYFKANKRLAKGEVESAIASLEKAIEISPGFAAAWNQLGTIAYQGAEFAKAEEHFRKALDLDPEAFAPLVNLGGVLLVLRRDEEALRYNDYAALVRPDDALANSQLGRTYFHLGNLAAAERYLRKAKRIDPSHFSLPQQTLAEVYEQQGQRDKAVREIEELAARHPDSPAAKMARDWLTRIRSAPTFSEVGSEVH